MSPKHLAKAYFASPWRPPALALVLGGLLALADWKLDSPLLSLGLLFALAGSLLGVFVAGIYQLTQRRWLSGLGNLAALPLIGLLLLRTLFLLMFTALFDDGPDDFGKDIIIPADMAVSDPVESFEEPGEPVRDAFAQQLIAAFSAPNPPAGEPAVSTDLAALEEFGTANRQKLIGHLAASPRWFVTEERGKAYAYRRLPAAGRWENSLNGFYSGSDLGLPPGSRFQTRIVIGFDGPVFDKPFQRVLTTAKAGPGTVPIRVVNDTSAGQGNESYFVLQSGAAAVEVFEQSGSDDRPATRLALAEVKRELELALQPGGGEAAPAAGARHGKPELELAKGMQGGIYQVRAFVNPGEAGRVYLKVFEATRNTPLSADRIPERSLAQMGWSANPEELFRYQSEVAVYEGDWGNFYPGRFELWFIPGTGAPERKLIERIFRIEGWMR